MLILSTPLKKTKKPNEGVERACGRKIIDQGYGAHKRKCDKCQQADQRPEEQTTNDEQIKQQVKAQTALINELQKAMQAITTKQQ